MTDPSRYELEYPDLFAALPQDRLQSVVAALDDDRLEGGYATRAHVALLIRSVTENLTDEQYTAAVLEHLHRTHD